MKGAELDFSGKVALVTGGSRGIGKGVSLALAERGARVMICGRKEEILRSASRELKELGYEVLAFPANVGKSDQVKALMEYLDKQFGKLDILVNNVGMNILTPSIIDSDEGLWDKVIETNLKGPYLVTKEAVRLIRKAGAGRVINISSIAARKATMGMGIYCIAKAGLEMLTRVLAVELAQERINVNAIAPSMVKTGFSKFFWGNESLLPEITRMVPMGRIAEVEDVVGCVLFLASELSRFVTGETITVDGGSMA
ncbi:MAG: SDR family oxidoreductase [Desulfobacteraceae bacterium]|jgi:2-deoxy-D-gluconate 3-dehydrogenase|nr:MAG: SDR family oxidoreductase [Desulfobacteraceae bacterium]